MRERLITLAALYRAMVRLHSALPRTFSKSGYAFPAWHYFLEVTRRCNLRCRMCQYARWFERTPGATQQQGELTTDEWRSVIDQTGRFSLLTFTGGEPFLREDIMTLLEHACRKRRTHVITNGTRLTEDRCRECVDLAPKRPGPTGLNFIGVSLQGPKVLHNDVTEQTDAFDKAASGITMLTRLRREARKQCPLVHVTAVIQPGNVAVLPEMPALVASVGANVLNLTVEMHIFDVETVGKTAPWSVPAADVFTPRIDPHALRQALDATRTAAGKAGIELRLPRMPLDQLLRYYDGGLSLPNFTCRSAWTNLFIGADGNVYPCLIHKIGNVREASLKFLWNSPSMREFRRRIRNQPFPVCQGCCELEYTG